MTELKCPSCGAPNVEQVDEGKYQCPYCGKTFTNFGAPSFKPNNNMSYRPDNNMVWAILSTIFCCIPLGIVSIIYALKVDELYSTGDYMGAQDAADNAKKYAQYAAVCGFIVIIFYFFIGMIDAMS